MSVRVRCTKCQTAFLAPDEPQGGTVACPKCGTLHKAPPPKPEPRPVPVAIRVGDDEPDEVASVFRPSPEAKERKSSRRWFVLIGLLLLVLAGVATYLAVWPRFRKRTTDPVARVAEAYLQALVDHDEEVQKRLAVVEDPPAIRSFSQPSRDKAKTTSLRGSFAPIAALNRRIEGEYSYDPAIGRFTPRNPLGPAAETLDALHEAKADAEKSGLYDKMASGDPDDIFDAAEGLGQVFQKLAEGTLAPKKILPTYKMLIDEAQPPLPAEPRKLALEVAESPKIWDALLRRPFLTLKADGPFVYDRAEVDAQVVDELGSPGDPPTPMRLTLVRFRLEGIDTSWRIVEARRILPSLPEPTPIPADSSPPAAPETSPAPPTPPSRSLGDPPAP
ncbi:hypothetical protein [Planctomyces sp. SH-PL62]|uniref:hypothetical protein n=1 Tax=Planctomyces sp. SH-PL62 TaxID=1636152 RepID=UPI00078D8F07|nr:hypothetical protein [Planctomyces sp. SH-PL62]AMV40509.1 hypothetical protein VT85_23975 [Planctomyces sp. SH-PL62]